MTTQADGRDRDHDDRPTEAGTVTTTTVTEMGEIDKEPRPKTLEPAKQDGRRVAGLKDTVRFVRTDSMQRRRTGIDA